MDYPSVPPSSLVSRLTPRERQVLALVAEGLTNKEIAHRLEISWRTVGIHRAHILDKLGTRRTALAIRAWLEAETATTPPPMP